MIHEQQFGRTTEKFVRLEKQLNLKMFRKVGELEGVELFETTEHLYDIPKEGYRPIQSGEQWGAEHVLGWFRGSYTVPAELAGQELFLIPNLNGEMLYYVNGQERGIFANKRRSAVGGNHWVNRLTERAKEGETLQVVLESWCGRAVKGTQPFQGREGWSGEFESTFTSIDVCVKDPLVCDTYFDLRVVNELLKMKTLDDFRRGQLQAALMKAHDGVWYDPDCVDEETWREGLLAVRAALAPVLAEKGAPGDSRPTVELIGHSHMDTGWLWTVTDTIKKCARTYANQLNLMERYPEHRFVQSSAYHSELIRRHYPDLFKRIAQSVKAGRYEPNGGVWVECDCNITGGESMVRQFLWGQRFTRRWFGYTSDCFWLPDTFGYSASIPQIMRGCGVRYFLTTKMGWNDTTRFPYDTFQWQGLDGTRVFTHLNGQGGGDLCPAHLNDLAASIRTKSATHRKLHAYGAGDGGGGPTFEQLETVRREMDLAGCPKVTFTTVSDFMRSLERETPEPPLYARELYLELHRGTLTNQHEIKRNNRKAEIGLHNAEALTVLEAVAKGVPADGEDLKPLWELTLLNQFHDILPGTCIPDQHDMTKEQMRGVRKALKERLTHTLTTEPGEAITAVNTLSFPRTGVWYAPLPAGKTVKGARCQTFTDLKGRSLTALAGLTLPPLSATPLLLADGAQTGTSPFTYDGVRLTTPFASIEFDENGAIASFVDIRCGRELRERLPLNTFLFCEEVSQGWDNWDVDADMPRKLKPAGKLLSRELVGNGPVELRLRSRWQISEKTQIEQDMVVYADSPLVRFDTLMHWQDDHRFLKAAFDTNVFAADARFEMQFGHVRRPTCRSTAEEMAKFEVPQHKFTDLSESRYGVAVLNDGKYGVSVDGGRIGLSLHKGGVRPDYNGDHGDHFVTYAFLPHLGDFSAANTVRAAYELNYPPVTAAGSRALPSLVEVEADNVIVETVKPCEDAENAYILRLYEAEGARAVTSLRFGVAPKAIARCDMLEQPLEALDPQNPILTFTPFHIETIKVEY